MSIAGKRSSLGDEYQLRVALHWLIRLLEDNTIEAIQVNSTGIPGENLLVTVDDIVILYKNGSACFIQAKKNQPDHDNWSFADAELKKELCNARNQLELRENSKVIFYSRSPFGELKKLAENCNYSPDYSAFSRNAAQNQLDSLNRLAKILERTVEITYSLVKKISFGPTNEFEDWDRQNKSDLQRLVPNVDVALPILERYLVSHETNLRDSRYLITRSDVLTELANIGLSPTPKRSEAEILTTFKQASMIGRKWLRTIDDKLISRPELPQLIELIEQGSKSILLTDRPGSGKTCLLLDIADYIECEKETVWGLLFIKGDLFTNLETEQDLVAKGLPEDIVGQCARLADYRGVIVIIDSLDVLSLSRQHDALKVFLGIIDRLEKLDKVTIIVACRNFDLEYDPLLRGRSWQHRVHIKPLDFDNEVRPLLIKWKVDVSQITPELQALLQIPQNLRIYGKLANLGFFLQSPSVYDLYNSFIEEVVVKNPRLSGEAIVALQNMSEQMMQQRSQSCSKVSFKTSEEIITELNSQQVLWEKSPGVLAFTHQILGDYITVRAALAKNQTLADFILEHPQLPFIRPAIRAFFFHLRAYQAETFRRQVWEVLSHEQIAYHVKRLVCESFSEIAPVEEDWRLLRRIFQYHPDLFRRLLWRANNGYWWNIITQHWLTEAKLLTQDRESWLVQFIRWLAGWINIYPAEVITFLREAITEKWATPQNLAGYIRATLREFQAWGTEGIQELLEILVENFEITPIDSLGRVISRWIQFTNDGDPLLWRYITKNVLAVDIQNGNLRNKLRCQPNEFHQENFLENRLIQSDVLLNLVLREIEPWSWSLSETSWGLRHSDGVIHSVDSLTVLLNSLESTLKFRAKKNDLWWQLNEPRLRETNLETICYFVIEAYKENAQTNIAGIESKFQNEELFRNSRLSFELGKLMKVAYPFISESVRMANQEIILVLYSERKKYENEFSFSVYREIYNFILWIPCIFRNQETQAVIDTWQNSFSYSRPERVISLRGGCVVPPLSAQDLLKLSDKYFFKLLRYYETYETNQNVKTFDRDLVGGFSEVTRVLRDACSLNPKHFIVLFPQLLDEKLHRNYICALVEGISSHLQFRFGNVKSAHRWEPVEPLPKGEELAETLLNWLERYFFLWEEGDIVSQALNACCDILIDYESAERLSLLLFWVYTKYPEKKQQYVEVWQSNRDIVFAAFNSIHGVAASAAITLCNQLLEKNQPVPETLLLLLSYIARDPIIYVKITILDNLPFLIYKQPKFGWQILSDILKQYHTDLWKYTENCFYYQYRDSFQRISPYLNRLLQEDMEENGDIWGRITTLASLAGHISQQELFATLVRINSNVAWKGTTEVFVANLNLQEHTTVCIFGLSAILKNECLSEEILKLIDGCFEEERKRDYISPEFAFTFINAIKPPLKNAEFVGFLNWLGYKSRMKPLLILELMEALIEKFETGIDGNLLWPTQPLIIALNEVLREADETDEPELIQRAINLQDRFLKLDIQGMEELLRKAERE